MFKLAWPWVLVCFPLPWMIWYGFPRAEQRLPAALKVPFFRAVLDIVTQEVRYAAPRAKITVLGMIWVLVLLALAGPRWVGEPQALSREGYNIMLALDISGSMSYKDMALHGRPATRLDVVKRAAEQFIRDRVGDRIGLILFGTRAYLQTPLTYDHRTLLTRIEDATVGLAGNTTSLGDALGLAVKRLQHVPAKGRVIILLTDGVNNSGVLAPLKAAELARADAIKIYTIGLGADMNPQAIGGFFVNMNAAPDLDEETLQEVAKMTDGRYFRATDMSSLHAIYQNINQMETLTQKEATVRPEHEYYSWCLALALVLFFYWFLDRTPIVASVFRRKADI